MERTLLEEIEILRQQYDKIDNYFEELPDLQRDIDYKISDLLHYIQNEKFNFFSAYKIVRELKKLRLERLQLNIDNNIKNTFDNQKFSSSKHRNFLMNDIYKKSKEKDYNYRLLKKEEIDEMIRR